MAGRRTKFNHGNTPLKHFIGDAKRLKYGTLLGLDGETRTPGGRYVDVFGGGEALITAQLPAGDIGESVSVRQYTTTSRSKDYIGDAAKNKEHVAKRRARFWYSRDGDAISWEVGKGKQIVYVDGHRHILTGVLPAGATIRAGCFTDKRTAVLLTKLLSNKFVVCRVALSATDTAVLESTTDIPFAYTETIWKDSDVQHLYSAFWSPTDIVTVEVTMLATTVKTFKYDEGVWAHSADIANLPAMTATTSMRFARTNSNPSALVGTQATNNALISNGVVSRFLSKQDSVAMTGQRVVACNSDDLVIALLVEDVDTTSTQVINKPPYGSFETYWVASRPIFQGPWLVATWYDSFLSLTGFDSGKLMDTWERSARNKYRRLVVNLRDSTKPLEERDVLSGGAFASTTSIYERYVMFPYSAAWFQTPVVPPLTNVVNAVHENMYSEQKQTYHRSYSEAKKFYCADPLNEVYLFLQMDGVIRHEFMSRDVRGFASPAPEDLPNPEVFTTQAKLILRTYDGEKYVDVEVSTRPINAATEAGLSWAHRAWHNFEPTMPYYTQPQPPNTGTHALVERNTVSPVNKPIDLCFGGVYTARDPKKTGVAYALDIQYDRPTLIFPDVVDPRYRYNIDGSLFTNLFPTISFFEGYRPCFTRDERLVINDSVGVDLRHYQDNHQLMCNAGVWTSELEMPSTVIYPEWADLAGWSDFHRRGGVPVWANLVGVGFHNKSGVSFHDRDAPPITVMTGRT